MDSVADQYHKERGIIIKNSLKYLIKRSNVEEEEDLDKEEVIDTRLQTVTFRESETVIGSEVSGARTSKAEASVSRQDSGVSEEDIEPQSELKPAKTRSEADDLGLGLSVQEMKAWLSILADMQ